MQLHSGAIELSTPRNCSRSTFDMAWRTAKPFLESLGWTVHKLIWVLMCQSPLSWLPNSSGDMSQISYEHTQGWKWKLAEVGAGIQCHQSGGWPGIKNEQISKDAFHSIFEISTELQLWPRGSYLNYLCAALVFAQLLVSHPSCFSQSSSSTSFLYVVQGLSFTQFLMAVVSHFCSAPFSTDIGWGMPPRGVFSCCVKNVPFLGLLIGRLCLRFETTFDPPPNLLICLSLSLFHSLYSISLSLSHTPFTIPSASENPLIWFCTCGSLHPRDVDFVQRPLHLACWDCSTLETLNSWCIRRVTDAWVRCCHINLPSKANQLYSWRQGRLRNDQAPN